MFYSCMNVKGLILRPSLVSTPLGSIATFRVFRSMMGQNRLSCSCSSRYFVMILSSVRFLEFGVSEF